MLHRRHLALLLILTAGIIAATLGAPVIPVVPEMPGTLASQGLSAQETDPKTPDDEVLVHLGDIVSAPVENTGGQGLLLIAVSEAEAAARHAGLAAESTDDLQAMKTHAQHVLHALDPTRVPNQTGPGMGFGTIQTAEDIATHVTLATEVEGVSDEGAANLESHAPAIAQSAENVARWSRQMYGLVERIRMAETAEQAAPAARELKTLADRTLSGEDLDGDGEVRWQDGEGGILQVQEHMNLLMAEMGL